ncbi:hypothetical protein NSQ93_13135 [Bacillus sp. FSL W8-0445]|uniref:DUF3238 domain-containing protein n=1 Tax=Bacillus licheniformis TaxID=1402 RepID=A0A8B5Y894_BACLI|nr:MULTISPECIES: hypothetical protein [Bacillus]AWV41506.1 hypothetical protein CD200_14045 [Bacillus licheniformis]AZN78707.1 hypothetical protein CXG95_06290 [Bacillus licheniformis]KYC96397.1 hypothetical protein B4164_2842 [Bacillus licheniformis]MCC2132970.1 DUF3238 domain-containing protein [Bacillus licheniformis]MCC2145333.1 DUF3238 domain-containing protein [Bacillus licheniformis]
MRKFFVLSFLLILFLCLCSIPKGYAKEIPDIETKVKNGHVTLKVNEKGDEYKFFKNGAPVYEGDSNEYSDDVSTIGDKYKIGIFQKDKLKKVVTLNVSNDLGEKALNSSEESYAEDLMAYQIQNGHLNVIADAESVQLSWDELPDKDGVYEVYRDDQKIGETTNQEFIDYHVKSGEKYNYSIQVSLDPPEAKKKEIEKKIQESGSNLSEEEKSKIMSVEGSLSAVVDMPENKESYLESKDSVLADVTTDENFSIQGKLPKDNMKRWDYKTFIPYKTVADPKPEISKTYLKGDNRGFSDTSSKFRTQAMVNTQFHSPTSITLFKDVSQSVRCSDPNCKKIIERKTASSSGIKLHITSKKSDYLHWTVTHAVGIPFGSYYPKIDYSYNVMLTKSMASISGKHDKAPNHEFYLSAPSASKSTTIYRYAVKSKDDFWNLWFFAPKKSWKTELF